MTCVAKSSVFFTFTTAVSRTNLIEYNKVCVHLSDIRIGQIIYFVIILPIRCSPSVMHHSRKITTEEKPLAESFILVRVSVNAKTA